MAILSVNSHVARGHVGNSATVFPLQCLGYEVWPVHTTLFSNHPGHGRWRGDVVEPQRVAEVLDGIADGGGFAEVEAVLTGYLGGVDSGEAALTAVAAVKAASKAASGEALYCCDPVIGDDEEGLYVDRALARWFGERAVVVADIVTPNRFELAYLSGRPVATEARISTLAVTAAGAWRVTTPKLVTAAKGAGDLLAALFLGRYLAAGDAAAALAQAVSSVFGLVAAAGTSRGGGRSRDLPLIAARAEITDPGSRFSAESLD